MVTDMTALLCLVVFASAITIDFAHARCIVAIGDRAGQRAARWSLVQWMASTVGILVAFKVTLWVLPFEAAGLYVGTLLAMRTAAERSMTKIPVIEEDLITIPMPRLRVVRGGYEASARACS